MDESRRATVRDRLKRKLTSHTGEQVEPLLGASGLTAGLRCRMPVTMKQRKGRVLLNHHPHTQIPTLSPMLMRRGSVVPPTPIKDVVISISSLESKVFLPENNGPE